MTLSVSVYFSGIGMVHSELGWDIINFQRSVDSVQILTLFPDIAVAHMVVLVHHLCLKSRFQYARKGKRIVGSKLEDHRVN